MHHLATVSGYVLREVERRLPGWRPDGIRATGRAAIGSNRVTAEPVRTIRSTGGASVPASAQADASGSDAVFKALADPSRRQLLDRLNARNGQNLGELCVGLHMARQSVSKHLAILESAGLVTTVRRGREKLHYLNAEPINEIFERWIHPYHRDRVAALGDLKRALEASEVERPQ